MRHFEGKKRESLVPLNSGQFFQRPLEVWEKYVEKKKQEEI
jgi:hypothetical protein